MSIYFRQNSILNQGRIEVLSTAALAVSPWTVCGWVYHEAGGSARTIISGTSAGMPVLAYGDTLTNFWAGVYGQPIGSRALDPGAAILNEWVFYAASYDSTDVRLYRGYAGTFALRATQASGGGSPVAGAVVLSRRWDDARAGLQGNLAEVAMFSGVLSEADLAGIYDARTGGYSAAVLSHSPLAYWRLRELPPTTTAIDEQGLVNGTIYDVEYLDDPDYNYRLLGSTGPVSDDREGWGMLI